jgi:hypothetical protein
LPCTRIHGHPPSTLLHPQQLPKRRLGTIPGPANPSSSPYACCSHCPFAKHHALAPCCRPNLVGILLFTPSWGIHHHWDSTTSIHLGRPPIDPLTASPDSLLSATFVILIFVDQKNAVRGKTVGHGHSGDPQACPVLAIVCRILHLHSFNAPPHMPLCALNATGSSISARSITALLHQGGLAFSICNNITLPILHQKGQRATGASALLAQGANFKTIKLLGRWKSDAAMQYLHLQSRMFALALSTLNTLR